MFVYEMLHFVIGPTALPLVCLYFNDFINIVLNIMSTFFLLSVANFLQLVGYILKFLWVSSNRQMFVNLKYFKLLAFSCS